MSMCEFIRFPPNFDYSLHNYSVGAKYIRRQNHPICKQHQERSSLHSNYQNIVQQITLSHYIILLVCYTKDHPTLYTLNLWSHREIWERKSCLEGKWKSPTVTKIKKTVSKDPTLTAQKKQSVLSTNTDCYYKPSVLSTNTDCF